MQSQKLTEKYIGPSSGGLICSIFPALIRYINKIYYTPTTALWFSDIVLLHSDHQQVSATHMAIFRILSFDQNCMILTVE